MALSVWSKEPVILKPVISLHAVLFFRDGVRNLAFQVKLFLAADIQLAAGTMRRSLESLLCIAARQVHRRQHIGLRSVRGLRRQDGGQLFIVDDYLAHCTTGVVMAVGDYREDRLSHIFDQTLGQNRIVVKDGAAIVGAGDVGFREDCHHTRCAAHGIEVDRANPRVGFLRHAERGVQRALCFRDIVGVGGLAQHMQYRRFVRMRLPDLSPGKIGRAHV